ncbi:MAG: hypothetical protein KJ902_00425 [Candidatus Omnitrophica bacterium]|nr:hypothetical protein [Candidatus Omnitrophota bacterium]MBU4457186.1 hypothetical protein [Candidatus Omnitrophota bacterium]
MKGFFVCMVLLFTCLNFSYNAHCAVEDIEEGIETQPQEELYKRNQPSRPILPPIVPSSPSGISPTPSPHIAVPPVTPRPIIVPSIPKLPKLPQIPKIPTIPVHKLPGTPVRVTVPVTDALSHLPRVPIIGSLIGRVANIGSKESEVPWIEVKGEFVERTLKINVDPQGAPVVKKDTRLSFEDIKIGDIVRVIYNQEGTRFTANFVSILIEEDIKAIEENLNSAPGAAPKESVEPK